MRAPASEHPPRRSLSRRLVRIFLRTLVTILIILLLVFLLIQTPFVQDFARAKAEKYLSRRLKTRVNIGHLDITFFRSVTLKDVYIEDLHHDTLLSAGLIDVRLSMLGLLHNNLDINAVHLSDLTAKVLRQNADTVFNYQFIIDAFAGKPAAKPDTTTGPPMKMTLNHLLLDNIRLVYLDTLTGNNATASIGHSSTNIDSLDLTKTYFVVSSLDLEKTILGYRGTTAAMTTGIDLKSLHTTGL